MPPPVGWKWSPWFTPPDQHWVPMDPTYRVVETPSRWTQNVWTSNAWDQVLNTITGSSGPFAISHNPWPDARRLHETAYSGWTNEISPPWNYGDAPYASDPYVRGVDADVPPGDPPGAATSYYDYMSFHRPDMTRYKMVGGYIVGTQHGFFSSRYLYVLQQADSTLIDIANHYLEGSWNAVADEGYETAIGTVPPLIWDSGLGDYAPTHQWEDWADFAVTDSKLRLFTHGQRAGSTDFGEIEVWLHNDQTINSQFPSHVGWSGSGANPNSGWTPEVLVCTIDGTFSTYVEDYFTLAWRNNGPDNYGPVYGLTSLTVTDATVLSNDYDDKWLWSMPSNNASAPLPSVFYVPKGGRVFVTELDFDVLPYVHDGFLKFQAFPTAFYSDTSPGGFVEADGAGGYVNMFAIQPQPLLYTHLPRIRYLIPDTGAGVPAALRMMRRNDNVGHTQASPRMQTRNDQSSASSTSGRLFGWGSNAYDPPGTVAPAPGGGGGGG